MKNIFRPSTLLLALSIPSVAFAAVTGNDLFQIFDIIGELIKTATPIAASLALLAFFWGLAMYVGFPTHYFGEGDHKKKTEARTVMLWGIIALFVILSIFGIVGVLQETFGLQNESIPLPSATPPGQVGP